MLLVATFLWSELIFIFLVLLLADQLQKSKENKNSFYMAIACGFLMCLQRNAGVFIAAGASIWIFVNEETWRHRIVKPTLFFLAVSSGLLIWNVYVWIFVPHEHFSFSEGLFQFAWVNTNSLHRAIVHVFLPIDFYPVSIFVGAFSGGWFYMKEEIKNDSALQLIFILTIVYLAFINLALIINIGAFPVDFGESDRFISVVVPFVGILLFKVFEKVFNKQIPSNRIWITILILCWLCYPLTRTIKNAIQWHEVR